MNLELTSSSDKILDVLLKENMLTQRRRIESISQIIEKNKESTGRGLATYYIKLIVDRKGEDRYKVANDLHK